MKEKKKKKKKKKRKEKKKKKKKNCLTTETASKSTQRILKTSETDFSTMKMKESLRRGVTVGDEPLPKKKESSVGLLER